MTQYLHEMLIGSVIAFGLMCAWGLIIAAVG
jgi:hypothetical protein